MATGLPQFTVCLVEDDAVHAKHLSSAVQLAGTTPPVARHRCAEELRSHLKDSSRPAPQLLVLDLGLPDAPGVELVREVREAWPDTKVLVVSVHTDERNVVKAIQAGASGYVVKDGDDEALAASIRDVMAGQNPISPNVARYLISYVTGATRYSAPGSDAPELTRRELDILYKMADGLSYQEAAESLDISRSTVEAHIRKLYRKLEVHSKTQALLRARQHGLL
ncbi:MAG: hypothetical protein RL653_1161 [Pseudomonadota bacterium]